MAEDEDLKVAFDAGRADERRRITAALEKELPPWLDMMYTRGQDDERQAESVRRFIDWVKARPVGRPLEYAEAAEQIFLITPLQEEDIIAFKERYKARKGKPYEEGKIPEPWEVVFEQLYATGKLKGPPWKARKRFREVMTVKTKRGKRRNS